MFGGLFVDGGGNTSMEIKKRWLNIVFDHLLFFISRDEATRTPDPYVPNVVRYQLRYIPIDFRLHEIGCKGSAFLRVEQIFMEKVMLSRFFVVPLQPELKKVP